MTENEKRKEITEIAIIDERAIRDKIYEVRGVKVMLDFELAEIYGYTTKAFNQQVKNNAAKFDDDFRFQLTRDEIESLSRSKFLTSMQTRGVKGGRTYLPWAFTESGIYMLMTVLRGELATRQTIHIIDDYISPKTLHLLQGAKDGVSVTVISDNRGNCLKLSDCADFQKEFPNIGVAFIQSKGVSHDRFIVLDYGTNGERDFHCGASSKDAGNRATAITEFSDSHIKTAIRNLLETMLANPALTLK